MHLLVLEILIVFFESMWSQKGQICIVYITNYFIDYNNIFRGVTMVCPFVNEVYFCLTSHGNFLSLCAAFFKPPAHRFAWFCPYKSVGCTYFRKCPLIFNGKVIGRTYSGPNVQYSRLVIHIAAYIELDQIIFQFDTDNMPET